MSEVAIIDFYVDEPTCLGVPPYFSVYPRYIAGALRGGGITENRIFYFSVDHLRQTDFFLPGNFEAIFIIGGSTVPGKYLATKIGTLEELSKFCRNIRVKKQRFRDNPVFIGGSFNFMPENKKKEILSTSNIFLVPGDLEKIAYLYAKNSINRQNISETELKTRRNANDISKWAVLGSFITRSSLFFPNLVQEIETFRGCTRRDYCSFCTEKFIGKTQFRAQEDIKNEIESLISVGNFFFRLGKHSDILTYGTDYSEFKNGFPKPNPMALEKLYKELGQVKNIKLLHMDNVNPGTIFHYPAESTEILKTITGHHTEGDTAALGVESVDPKVISANNLKLDARDSLEVIRIINKIGSHRKNGIPLLLPGVNLIHGLLAESKDTFRMNYEFLLDVLSEGLLLRRINLRQAIIFPGTNLYTGTRTGNKTDKKESLLRNKFLFYRDKIRNEIDKVMLGRVFPAGTNLRNVLVEKTEGEMSMGRPLGSYPITCKFFNKIPRGTFQNAIIVGHEARSVYALPEKLAVNSIPASVIQRLPGIGKRKKEKWLIRRPFHRKEDFYQQVEPGKEFDPLKKHVVLD